MRLFALIGALLIAAGVYVSLEGAIYLNRCLELGQFSHEIWTDHFWLADPAHPSHGMGPNARWFVRLGGGVFSGWLGVKIIKIATR